jgi:hypothetical protein
LKACSLPMPPAQMTGFPEGQELAEQLALAPGPGVVLPPVVEPR